MEDQRPAYAPATPTPGITDMRDRGLTIADRLEKVRRRSFVGRIVERKLFQEALTTNDPPFSVIFVHGTGGVGKTALLSALADMAQQFGTIPVRLNGRCIKPSPQEFWEAWNSALGAAHQPLPEAETGSGAGCGPLSEAVVPAGPPGVHRTALLLDSYEQLEPIDGWVREGFLPLLPADTIVVIASRNPPRSVWTSDQGWRRLVRVVALTNLSPVESKAYLEAEGLPESLHEQVLATTHGHPLALSLLVDALSQRKDPAGSPREIGLTDAPDMVRILLERFTEEIPTERHRRAVEVCAHARVTTEASLRSTLGGDDTEELFAWLRRRSFIEEGPEGLFPHALARDVFDTDLSWRDRTTYQEINRRSRQYSMERIQETTGRSQQQAIADLLFLQRANPAMRPCLDWSTLGKHYPDALQDSDRSAILEMTERYQGPESAKLVAYWMDRQPKAFVVTRGPDSTPIGYNALLRLHEASTQDLDFDPGARAMWDYAQLYGPPLPGEEVIANRFLIDGQRYQDISPTLNISILSDMYYILHSKRISWFFVGSQERLDRYKFTSHFLQYHRAKQADYQVGGRRYQVIARDFRRSGMTPLLDLLNKFDFDYGPEDSFPDPPPPMLALPHREFAEAVRQALRDLHKPEALARNPLIGCRLVRNQDSSMPAAEVLADLLHRAAESLSADPRGGKFHRVIDRTYLRPAATQERAAELLGLPFSTYRRHLTAGLRRITELLWNIELYGSFQSLPPTVRTAELNGQSDMPVPLAGNIA